ncbi:RNA-dependent RNA polymerase 2 Short=AtRDRP2 [Rhizoctonia solani AG-1 IB]|uniref:RNA-dependent RNA polymerase 2 Short=AtRDRP2 n=1 Tax=Thanatephorus cucumeris (strain AG1-IB / isolate 7/3/14) TaxID=1108050 RepID=M5C1M4_THACB|nr:RNA-dependent RNA polymerase 2 Short=AtRDRP2 [Rhizoctonia solani AG-1 IB]
MAPVKFVLRAPLQPDDDSWVFQLPSPLPVPRRGQGKLLQFSPEGLVLTLDQFSSNRVLHQDDSNQYILASFAALRFKDNPPSVAANYIQRVLAKGLFLNGQQYRFYHHSNSQLRSRSCWLRAANTDEELDRRIETLCDVSKINNIAKRAKRIGLLFSGAEIDWDLKPIFTKDIPDITIGEELFSDGCGLISMKFMMLLAKKKRIIHRGRRYTPSVIQIRYRGYKGVLAIHPQLDRIGQHHVHFRDSMRKLKTGADNTFSVVDCSRPYQFARLNNDIIVLLSALGITNEALANKQDTYFKWIESASKDDLAERVFMDGIEDEHIQAQIRNAQVEEVNAFQKPETGKDRSRIFLFQSRFLFGVCDPFGLLEEGEVHVRVMEPRKGETTLSNIDLMVVRNPCLHPGDILKLRAVHHTELDHLVDCIVFSGKGKRAAPAMSSGGDLDGDRFTVVWDPDIVPRVIAQSYDYPAPRTQVNLRITRKDLATHFSNYNSMDLGRVASLHNKWARTLKGAMSKECQELNALHSQSVDGARIRIPERLTKPPEVKEPFVLDVLIAEAHSFSERFLTTEAVHFDKLEHTTAEEALNTLMSLDNSAFPTSTEDEIVQVCRRFARRNMVDFKNYLHHVDFSALSANEKYALCSTLDLNPESHPFIWNSLLRSDVVPGFVLAEQNLAGPLPLQRLYSSRIQGRQAFFEYLKRATTDFMRKLIIVKTDDRFGVGIFIRGRHAWDEDCNVNQDVLVHSFQPSVATGGQLAKPTKNGYMIYASDGIFQLFERHRANTFIFLKFATEYSRKDVNASIALQKISEHVRQQIGAIRGTQVETLEIHVVSNRDKIAQEYFDLRFSHVQTENILPRFEREVKTYIPKSVKDLRTSWANEQVRELFSLEPLDFLEEIKAVEDMKLEDFLQLAWTHNAHAYAFYVFEVMATRALEDPSKIGSLQHWLGIDPAMVYALLKVYMEQDEDSNPFRELDEVIVRSIISSANTYSISAPMTIERLRSTVNALTFGEFSEIMWLTACSVRSLALAADILATLTEVRTGVSTQSPSLEYAHRHLWAVCLDRAEDADSECPCDDTGRPRRQRQAPPKVPLKSTGEERIVDAQVRVDSPAHVRLHAHVRLQAASQPERGTDPRGRPIMDGSVSGVRKGELRIHLMHTPPIDFEDIEWYLYPAGDIVTSRAMLDSIVKLQLRPNYSTALHHLITGYEGIYSTAPTTSEESELESDSGDEAEEVSEEPIKDWTIDEVGINWDRFNESQKSAILSISHPLSLVWGPPGTGKTTVVVTMLRLLLRSMPSGSKILMTASTHNAVDNVLGRFIKENDQHNLIAKDQLLRVATDINKVHPSLRAYTMDAAIGGSMVDNRNLIKKAEKRVRDSTIVFTTCAGAGLGVLRRFKFQIVLVDEASQITEAAALIPIVKGCQKAVLVGDHVQLRPTVRPQAKALDYDVSLLERLYTGPERAGMSRIMLDTQYRFPAALAQFPSTEFYNSSLKTGIPDDEFIEKFEQLAQTAFPWPRGTEQGSNALNTNIFVSCKSEESYGRSSKENIGQAEVVMRILKLLRTRHNATEESGLPPALSITVLSPYSRQVKLLRGMLDKDPTVSKNTEVHTIDGFQGREAEVIIFTTVRSNSSGDIGFLEDERRLNVALTRAQLGRIIVGNEDTLGHVHAREDEGTSDNIAHKGNEIWGFIHHAFSLVCSDPTTPLAKYSERRPDLYSLSATHAFDWEAARGNRPPPLASAIGNGAPESLRKKLARAAAEDGMGGGATSPTKAARKRIVRKKSWRQRISELPSFVYEWFWDTVTLSNLPLPPPETSGRVLGGLLHVVHFVTRYSVLRSQKVEEGDWQDMQREIHIVAGLEQEDPEPWFSWVCPSGLAHISY